MSDDIERALSEAFHGRAATITADRLRHPELRTKRPSRLRRSIIVATGLAVIAGILIAGGYVLSGRNTPATSTGAAYVGSRWELSSVQHDGKRSPVPASYGVDIAFAPGGTIVMSDSVNALSGHYTTAPGGFTTSDMATTLAGYVGTDPVRTQIIEAIDAITFPSATNGTSASSVTVDARVVADQLIITVAGYQLTLDRAGPAADPARPAPTSGATSSTNPGFTSASPA